MTTTTQPDLFAGIEDAADFEDGDFAVYRHLTDDHRVVTCPCGRELLAANLPGEPHRGFRETESDALPPLVYRWVGAGRRRAPQCCGCYVAERRANRGRVTA